MEMVESFDSKVKTDFMTRANCDGATRADRVPAPASGAKPGACMITLRNRLARVPGLAFLLPTFATPARRGLDTAVLRPILFAGAALALLLATALHAADRVPLSGYVLPGLNQMENLGRVPAAQEIKLAIGLPLRNAQGLTNLLRDIYNPASPKYRHYLTPQQFSDMFGPTELEYQAVTAFAMAHGLEVSLKHPNRMVLDVTGTASAVENAFQITLNQYKHPTENRNFFAPSTEPSVPFGLSILDVSGLNNATKPHPHYKLPPANPARFILRIARPPSRGANSRQRAKTNPLIRCRYLRRLRRWRGTDLDTDPDWRERRCRFAALNTIEMAPDFKEKFRRS